MSSFEQHTLARFLSRGHFEKHINRMRKFYRSRRNRLLQLLEESAFAEKLTILEEDAGLHFLLRVDTALSDPELEQICREAGAELQTLSRYYHSACPAEAAHCLVVNYSGLRTEQLSLLEEKLKLL